MRVWREGEGRSITLAKARTRIRSLRGVSPFHPLGIFTIGTFFSALSSSSSSPSGFFSSTTANWCMARDWSDCCTHTHTHEKGALPLEGRPRHPVGKTGAAPENCTRPCVTEFCPRLLANWFLHWLCSTRGTRAFFPSPSIFFVRRNSLRDFFPWLRFEILSKRRGRRICWDAFREWIGTDCCENVFTAVCVEANGKIIVSEMLYFNFGSFRLGSRQNFIPFVIFHSEE